MSRRILTHIAGALTILLLGVLFYGCTIARSAITGKKRAYAYTWQQEIQLGKEVDGQIASEYGIYDDPDLSAYVTRVGERVLAQSHLRRPDAAEEHRATEFTFRVLDSPIVNAFALPGGYVYVTRGLLAHLQNEAQLAVVLGHEVGHVVARHSSQRALKGQLAQIGLIGAAIGGELLGVDGNSILQGGSLATQLLLLRYSRDDEREADALGVEYSAMSGYAAAEGAAFFTSLKRISEASGQSLPGFLSSHPDPGDREARIPRLASQYAADYEMTEINEAGYIARLAGIVFGEDPRQGFVEAGQFHHPELRFSFPVPSDWKTQNKPSQVALFTEKQDAVILFEIVPDVATPADGARKLSAIEGLTVQSQSAVQINGLPAHQVEATLTGQNNQALRILATFIQYQSRIYRFLGFSAPDTYSGYERLFQNTMRGFRPLVDQRILAIQPVRIRLRSADRNAAFRTFVPSDLPSGFNPEQLAIVNQLMLDTQVVRGSSLKLIGR